MTVLEEEKDVDERSFPPTKKPCLSLSGKRSRIIAKSISQEPHSSVKEKGTVTEKLLSYDSDKMLNGYQSQSSAYQDPNCDIAGDSSDGLRIASLCNLGNTCFLNSVIYTLRFAPSFLHNLHHLATDLNNLNDKQYQTKIKSSSLGRTGVSLTSSGSRSLSSKDLLAFAGSAGEISKPKIQYATEKLHELFIALRIAEVKENNEPYQPDAFLQALREVNPIFEGNQQQDAHELLVCLLDNIRETFQLLVKHRESQFGQRNGGSSDLAVERLKDTQSESSGSSKRNARKSWKKKKVKSVTCSSQTTFATNINGMATLCRPFENGHADFQERNGELSVHRPESKKCFISEDFEGVSLLRTTCIECEHVTERKEPFCDICVPIEMDRFSDKDDDDRSIDSSEIYRRAVVTSELLCGRDKYWCGRCLRYNEAKRAVCFPSLPRLLILQLKRFSTAAGSMEKINNHMPTPLVLRCFCEECCNDTQRGSSSSGRSGESRHSYNLYSVIMHQGATMTAGHYIAYTRIPEASAYHEHLQCDRDNKRSQNSAPGTATDKPFGAFLSKILRSKPSVNETKEQPPRLGCRGMDCCGVWHEKHAGTWLECDDEAVRVIQWQELQDKLAPNPRNSATPYLLFYVRSTT